jgi:hypothetical protein
MSDAPAPESADEYLDVLEPDAASPIPPPRPPSRLDTAQAWLRLNIEPVVTVGVVLACVLVVFKTMQPSKVFLDSTPTGGDTGAHVWAPAYLRDHLLPHWRLSGWAPSWYAGFPVYQFYMVLPPLLIVVLNTVLPYGVAFKIVTILGVTTLPASAYVFGRLSRFRFPGPALLSVATLPFLFDTGFNIYGGNIASTLAGEFNFSCALSLCLIYLGLLQRLLRERRGRAITAVFLALTVLSHLLVGVFAAVATVAFLIVHGWRNARAIGRTIPSLVVGVCVTGFWTVPFYLNNNHTIDMGWHKVTDYWHQLLAPRMLWAVLLLPFAGLRMYRTRDRALISFGLAGTIMALVVRFIPDGSRLWNARMLGFVWLSIYLLAAFGVLEGAHLLSRDLNHRRELGLRRVGAPIAALIAVVYVGVPTQVMPFTTIAGNGRVSFLGLQTHQSYLTGWIRSNEKGYEHQAAWPEYKAINDTMAQVGRDHGCGRALWEYDGDRIGSYGTPLAMMLLPYWTKGCIDSMEGLYFESSPSTPFHFLMAAEVTKKPSNPVTFPDPGVYRSLDLSHGIEHMQLYGIRYYMAQSADAIAQAKARPELTEVARSGPWVVYELTGSDVVTGIDRLPYVEANADIDWKAWRDTGLATWDPIGGHRYYAATNGPATWPRIKKGDDVPDVPATPVTVTGTTLTDSTISFHVDRVGQPVLVKVNYFPNWQAHGAQGPFRVTPNLMVVVPTANDVRLTYGRTQADYLGLVISLVGLIGVAALTAVGRRRYVARLVDRALEVERAMGLADLGAQGADGDTPAPVGPDRSEPTAHTDG